MHLVGCTIEIYCDTRPCERHILSSLLFFNFVYLKKSRDSVGGIVTRLLAGRSGFISWQEQDIILFSETSRAALWPTHPRVQWVGTG